MVIIFFIIAFVLSADNPYFSFVAWEAAKEIISFNYFAINPVNQYIYAGYKQVLVFITAKFI
jgi:hypothetical protein